MRKRSYKTHACLLIFFVVGCLDTTLIAENTSDGSPLFSVRRAGDVERIDLLLVMDKTSSVVDEQKLFLRQLPALVRALATGDRDGGGSAEFRPVDDIHLGVISSDLGGGGDVTVQGCEGRGDDAVLQHRWNPAADPELYCDGSYPPFLSYLRSDGSDPEKFGNDLACMASLERLGCGLEQPLEAALKALWPSTNGSIEFQHGVGRGDVTDDGFLRMDSLIVVLILDDEDDCSSWNNGHFSPPPDRTGPGEREQALSTNLWCVQNQDNLYPVYRYVDGLKALRPGAEDLVVLAAVAGVPPAAVDGQVRAQYSFENQGEREAFYQQVLDHPDMAETIDPGASYPGGNLAPSCTTETGRAYPPRRLLRAVRGLGLNGAIHSICRDDFTSTVDAILDTIQRRLWTPGI